MSESKSVLVEKLNQLARSHWEAEAEPLLLSQVGAALQAASLDYKSILEDSSIRRFVSENCPELKVVQHPNQFAKIGIIPVSEEYEFPSDQVPKASLHRHTDSVRRSRRALYEFISALADLPESDTQGVIIPTSVLIQLLEGKR